MIPTPRWARRCALLLLAAAAGTAPFAAAHAQSPAVPAGWPSKPIRVIVPGPAGGVLDTLTRTLSEHVSRSIGQPVVIDNRAGGNGVIGLEACAGAPADGLTLCAVYLEPMSTLPVLDPPQFARFASIEPVSLWVRATGVMYASPASGIDSIDALVKRARATPGQLAYASFGAGTAPHLLFEWLKATQKIDLTHVPYKGSAPAVNDVMGGQVALGYVALGFAVPHIRAGRLKPLAVLGDRRSPLLPDVPALGELALKFPYDGAWFGLAAPRGTAAPIKAFLAARYAAAVNDPEVRGSATMIGYTPVGSTPEAFARVLEQEREQGAALVKLTGVTKD
jgi:tripartite-type tricarboxylate transporter receptor subunit TctC